MSTSFDERISALIDDELTDFELRRVTDEVMSDEALKQRFQRYSLIGDAMRNEMPTALDMDFSSRVMASIDEEPAAQHPPRAANDSRWKKPLAGAAIAASVAAMALVSLQTMTGSGGVDGMVASVAPTASVSDPASVVPQSPTQVLPKLANTVLPSMPAKGMVTTVSAEQSPISGMSQAAAKSYSSGVNGFLTTHSEFVSRPGVMSRIRVMGFDAPQQ